MLSNVAIPYTGANLNGNEAHCSEPQAWSVLAAQSGATLGCLVILFVNLCVLVYFLQNEEEERNLGLFLYDVLIPIM